jgi:hypothetical protein
MNRLAPMLVASSLLAAAVLAQEVTEPKSGAKFAAKDEGMSLLGVAVRTKTLAKVKVYAIGLYVADSALSGPLKAYKGKTGSPEFARAIVDGDFKKRVVLKFQRDLSDDQIRDGFRDALKGAGAKTDVWVNYFTSVKTGSEAVVAWTPGTGLETKVAGLNKSPINDKAFASSVFGIWLGDKPIQDDIKRELVSKADAILP